MIDEQVPYIPLMKQFTKPQDRYVDIALEGNLVISTGESRDLLARASIQGEIVHTPGHSEDSISLLLDGGQVFTGDLTPEELAWGETAEVVQASWQRLREKGARTIYPAHGNIRPIQNLLK